MKLDEKKLLGDLQKYILLSIEQGCFTATQIKSNIFTKIGKEVSVGALYTVLDRLNRLGYIDVNYSATNSTRGYRKDVKVYSVTVLGLVVLQENIVDLLTMIGKENKA
jgi:PadR family transcriptional regulator PadR